MKIELKGKFDTREVWLNGKKLSPEQSWQYRNHSPTGFCWGYSGSGPAQLALAICLEIFHPQVAEAVYQMFKRCYIAPLPQGDFYKEIEIHLSKLVCKTP